MDDVSALPVVPVLIPKTNLIEEEGGDNGGYHRRGSCDGKGEHDEVVEDWNLPMDFHLFARHETHTIYLNAAANTIQPSLEKRDETINNHNSAATTMRLECVESLTPLDMMGLSSGDYDATGHCLWLGAFFLLAVLDDDGGDGGGRSNHDDCWNEKDSYDCGIGSTTTRRLPLPASVVLSEIFRSQRVIELGCGTGIGGLALCLSTSSSSSRASCRPAYMCFTDADPEVLKLCEKNCITNLGRTKAIANGIVRDGIEDRSNSGISSCMTPPLEWKTFQLAWGQDLESAGIVPGTFDVVLATDVLYDIGMLPSLLETASACLVDDDVATPTPHRPDGTHQQQSSTCDDADDVGNNCGYFCLSHVPRACYNTSHPPVPDLEAHIVEQARIQGFDLAFVIRPEDCPDPRHIPHTALNYVSMCELQQVGAAMFLFSKKAQTVVDKGPRGE